jgi:hypothetical protein
MDPWLPERLAHLAYVMDGEARLDRAVRAAIETWLVDVRRLVLGPVTSSAADSAADSPADAAAAVTAAGDETPPPPPPDLSGISAADPVWQAAVRDLVRPVILDMFGERFLAMARTATISDLPYRERHMEQVFSRLRLFPRELMEEIRPELAEALSEGEAMDLIRDRVAATLDFDTARDADDTHWHAESRRLQGRIHEVERALEQAELDAADRAALRRERSQLYSSLRRADQKWQWKARRIARTETMGAINGGSFAGATARADQLGEEQFKQWLATDDARTRPNHVAADGQVRPIKVPFDVGGHQLMYPGEPGGPADEVINCRCTPLFLDSGELTDEQRAQLADPTPPPSAAAQEAAAEAAVQAAASDPVREETTMTVTDETAAPADQGAEAAALPTGWRGVLAPLDTQSGDGRILATPAELRLRTAPISLLFQPELDDFHGGAVVAGRIDRAWIDGGMLMGEGCFDLGSDNGREAARLLAGGFSNGISIDPDDVEAEEWWFYADGTRVPDEVLEGADWDALDQLWEDGARPVMAMTDWRLMSATLVSQPAFDEARVEPVYDYVSPADAPGAPDAAAAAAVTAAVTGDTTLPIGDRGASWDGAGAKNRIFEKFTDSDGNVDVAGVSKGFLYRDDDADDQTKAAYKLPFADVIDGTLTIIPAGVAAAAGGRGVNAAAGISDADKTTIKGKICTLYGKIQAKYDDWPDCPFADEVAASAAPRPAVTASVADALAAERLYDAAWFDDPQLTGYTGLTIADDGRVYGHLAPWHIDDEPMCHIGYADMCTSPPRSNTGYAYFHTGEVKTADGGRLAVGRISLGAGHADHRLGYRAAAEHYDDTCSCVAVVRAGEDEHGIWVAGALVEDITPQRIAELRRSPLSGDWRRVGGQLELVAALAVNTAGFPIPRVMAASAAGRQTSLVAAGAIGQLRLRRRPRQRGAEPIDYVKLARLVARENRALANRDLAAAALARRIGRDHQGRLAALDARIARARA